MMSAIQQMSANPVSRGANGTTVLLVEQNFLMASQLADRYIIIDDGRSVQHGEMKDLVNDTATIQKYLGAA